MAEKRKKAPSFKLEIPADTSKKTELLEKLQKIRGNLVQILNRPVNNYDILEHAVDYWIEEKINRAPDNESTTVPGTYISAKQNKVDQKFFITTKSNVKRIVDVAASHAKHCQGKLIVKKTTKKGHVAMLKFSCTSARRSRHNYLWSSSPYLPTGKYLVNDRINHAFICSGMLPSQYARFCTGAGIGVISVDKRDEFFKKYKHFVKGEYEESTSDGLLEEIGSYEDLDGIDIITDARHGWRKNSKDTSVVAIGEKTHKVIDCVSVSHVDDRVTQRHEKIGTEKIYNNLDHQGVSVKVHTHDRNASINKMVKDHPFTINQNDTWHGVKSVKYALGNVSSGPRYKEGKTWSEELKDKVEPVATHFHWAIRNCAGNSNTLLKSLENIVEHYKDNHEHCHSSSRCKMDNKYEPHRTVLTDPVAEKLLLGVIKNSTIYKNPEDFVLGCDTFFVESFNNTLNIYEDKRIAFGSDQYTTRAYLATCHWNENVNRPYTSISQKKNPTAPRRQTGKKVYTKQTFKFRKNIWDKYIKSIYGRR